MARGKDRRGGREGKENHAHREADALGAGQDRREPHCGDLAHRLPAKRAAVVQYLQSGFRRSLHVSESHFAGRRVRVSTAVSRATGGVRQRTTAFGRQALACDVQRIAGRSADARGSRGEVRAARGLSLAGARQLAIHIFTRERRAFDCARKCGRGRQGNFAGARFSPAGENGFFRFRFPGQFAFANRKTADGERLGTGVELSEFGIRIRHRLEDAAEAATRSAGGAHQLFGPVSLFFFFFLVFILSALRGNDLQPMNYFFLACAFFAFHLLLAYLADHISIHLAFVISSIVSIALVVSYLRLVVDLRFAAVDAGLTQLVYLVLFSYAFFFEGFTGLAVTIGAILTLFVVMQMTGRVRWDEKLGTPFPRKSETPA